MTSLMLMYTRTIDNFRIINTKLGSSDMLMFPPDTGLQKIEKKPANPELGTMIRHPYARAWQMRVKHRTGGKTWKPVTTVPKIIRVQALLLSIPL